MRSPTSAVIDKLAGEPLARRFPSRDRAEDGRLVCLKIWSCDRPIPLSERVPVLENMGFRVVDEHTYHDRAGGAGPTSGSTT